MPPLNVHGAGSPVGKSRYCQQVTVPGITTGAYTGGNSVGTIMTFPNVAQSLGTGRITGMTLTDLTVQAASAGLTIVIFKAAPATASINKTAFGVAAADVPKLIASFKPDPSDFFAAGTPLIWSNMSTNPSGAVVFSPKDFDLGQGNTSLFAQLWCSGTPNWGATANPLTLTIDVEAD